MFCLFVFIIILFIYFLFQIVEALESHSRLLVSLYQPFMTFSKEDQDDEVCSNSVFGLGMLAKNALPEMAG